MGPTNVAGVGAHTKSTLNSNIYKTLRNNRGGEGYRLRTHH